MINSEKNKKYYMAINETIAKLIFKGIMPNSFEK